MRKNQKGFTLIELLVVIAIIGLLSTLAVVALTSARAKARDAKRISDVKQVQTALELYFADKGGKYPAVTTSLGVTGALILCSDGFGDAGTTATTCDASDTTFMGRVPRDPSAPLAAGAAACSGTVAGVGCDYGYIGADTNYKINFVLEGASGELQKGINCATQDGMAKAVCP